MSKIGIDFDNVHIAIEAEGHEAYNIYKSLNIAFERAGMPLVDKVTIINGWERNVKKGPAKGLHVDNFDFGISN